MAPDRTAARARRRWNLYIAIRTAGWRALERSAGPRADKRPGDNRYWNLGSFYVNHETRPSWSNTASAGYTLNLGNWKAITFIVPLSAVDDAGVIALVTN